MSSGEVLFLAHRIPYPPNKGDKIRSWRILEYLATRFDVHLAAFVDDPADMQHEAFLRTVAASVSLMPISRRRSTIKSGLGLLTRAPLSAAFYDDGRMKRKIAELRARPLVAEFGFSSAIAQYLLPKTDGRPLFYDLCDADSAKWKRFAERRDSVLTGIFHREQKQVEKLEARIVNEASASFAISASEAAILEQLPRSVKPVDWFGNGVDTDYFDPAQDIGPLQRHDVVFTGAMDYWPNEAAAFWFLQEIWPSVRQRVPGATFAIVGSNPRKELLALDGADGVAVTGRVPDIRPFLFGAAVAIAPMDIARGVQNKVLEAMAAGRAVVCTSQALEGIAVQPDTEILVENGTEEFAETICSLIDNKDRAQKLGAAARQAMKERYTWPAQMARFGAAIDRVVGA